jgi:hypothetical protein
MLEEQGEDFDRQPADDYIVGASFPCLTVQNFGTENLWRRPTRRDQPSATTKQVWYKNSVTPGLWETTSVRQKTI